MKLQEIFSLKCNEPEVLQNSFFLYQVPLYAHGEIFGK